MGELVNALPAFAIFISIVIVAYFLVTRRYRQYNNSFKLVAQQLSMDYSEDDKQTNLLNQWTQHFSLFQEVGQPLIECVIMGRQENTTVCLANVVFRWRGVEGSWVDYCTLIWIQSPLIQLPPCRLRLQATSRAAKLENQLNAKLFGQEVVLHLPTIPQFSQYYRLTSSAEIATINLFNGSIGRFFLKRAEISAGREFEGNGDQLIYYKWQAQPATPQEIIDLYQEAVTLKRAMV